MLKPTLRNKNKEYIDMLMVIFLSKNETSFASWAWLSFSLGLGELLALGCNFAKASWDNLPILEFKSLS